jgi:hypothetical protein
MLIGRCSSQRFRPQEIKKVTASDRSAAWWRRPVISFCPSDRTAPNKSHHPPLVIPSAAEGPAVRPGSRTKVSVPLVLPQNRHPRAKPRGPAVRLENQGTESQETFWFPIITKDLVSY